MRLFHRTGVAALALGVALALAGTVAVADELMVMPYACTVVGGRPMLTPSRDESHRVIGGRENHVFTACSPANPRQCRSWTVHRFDIDCGGARVPWVSVVEAAAAERMNRRAWIEGGRLQLRMGPWWSMAPDDPCAGWQAGEGRWQYGRLARYCAERRATMPPSVVEMPVGFAPMLGIQAYFVGVPGTPPGAGAGLPGAPPLAVRSPPDVARMEPPPPQRSDAGPYARADAGPPLRSEPAPFGRMDPVPPARPDLPPQAARVEPPQQAARTEPAQPARTDPPREVVVRDVTPKIPPVPQPAAAQPAPAASGVVVPKIINRPDAAARDTASADKPPPSPAASEIPKSAPPSPQPAQRVAIGTPPPPPPKEVVRQDTGPQEAAAKRDPQSISVSLLSSPSAATTTAIVAFVGLTIALLAAFAWARRREHARLASAGPHDIHSVSLDGSGRPARRAPRLGFGRGPARQPAPPRPAAPPAYPATAAGARPTAPMAQGVPANIGDQIPRTKVEALQVLGLGVSPDSTEVAIKKVVDGLRLSWHPDLARSEPDRLLRELRLKQINAAWELIRGKRVEA